MNSLKKILEFVPLDYKNRLYLFSFFVFASTFLDVISIGLFFPILNFLINKETGFNFLDRYIEAINISDIHLILLILSILILSFVLKNLLVIYINVFQTKFTTELSLKLSKDLFSHYLSLPMKFHLSVNSNRLIRNTRDEIFIFVSNILNNILYVISDLVLVSIFAIFLISVSTFETISFILFFLLVSYVIFIFSKNKIMRNGQLRLEIAEKTFKFLREGFSSIREIKIYSIKDYFVDRYENEARKSIPLSIFINIVNLFPRVIFEILTVFIFVFLILYSFSMQQNFTQLIPILGVYVLIIYRIAPSMTRILQNTQKIKHYMPSFYTISSSYKETLDNFNDKEENYIRNKDFEFKSIELKNIKFEHKKNETIFDNLNLTIPSESRIIITGKSGCGKSTLLDLICGFIKPSSGTININGKNASISDMKNFLSQVSYVSQLPFFIDNNLITNIALSDEKDIDVKKIIEILNIVELQEFAKQIKNGLKPNIGEGGALVSGGQRQRIALARSLYFNPNIIILDEATNAIDFDTKMKILRNIHTNFKKLTLVMVSHSGDDYGDMFKKYEVSDKRIKELN